MLKRIAEYDAIIICAGYNGIRCFWELNQLNLTVRCYDAAPSYWRYLVLESLCRVTHQWRSIALSLEVRTGADGGMGVS